MINYRPYYVMHVTFVLCGKLTTIYGIFSVWPAVIPKILVRIVPMYPQTYKTSLITLKKKLFVIFMLASETLAMLQPIFESLRADSENSSMFSFPMLTSSNVKFHKVNSLLRRTNLPRISVSQCHSVSNRMIHLCPTPF